MARSRSAAEAKGRLSVKEMRRQRRARQQLLTRTLVVLGAVVAIALLSYGVWNLVRPKLGQGLPQQARTHISVGDPHEPYNSDPPTSGPHASPVDAGFYESAPPDENLVHNLEHGYIILWYNCSALDEAKCQGLTAQIQAVLERARPAVITTGAKKLIAVPRPSLDTAIALTSWGRLYKLAAFDEAQILQFIYDNRGQAPEGSAP